MERLPIVSVHFLLLLARLFVDNLIRIYIILLLQIMSPKMKCLKLLFQTKSLGPSEMQRNLSMISTGLPSALKQALFDFLTGSSALTCLHTPHCCQPVTTGLQVKFTINRRNVVLQSQHAWRCYTCTCNRWLLSGRKVATNFCRRLFSLLLSVLFYPK